MAWVPPDSFDEYRLVKLLGRGSVGQVWIAHDTVLDRLVAVKLIADPHAQDAGRARLFTEARAAARVRHPNIVGVYRVGEVESRPYLISEYVRGESLDAIARPIAWPRLLEIALGLARGLAAAHRQGVLHGALEPRHAIVSNTGDVKLRNFGLATLRADLAPSTSTATRPGEHAPSRCVAPEVQHGEPPTPRSDVYSLGALLSMLVTGTPPRSAPGIDPAFAAVVERCLRRDPHERYASGDTVREALEALAPRTETIAPMPPPGSERRPASVRRVLRVGPALALVALLSSTSGGGPVPTSRHTRRPSSAAAGADRPGACTDGMVQVPGGTFTMGRTEGEGDADEQPYHPVTLSTYCIDTTEVTVAAYAACVAAQGCSAAVLTANWSALSAISVAQQSSSCNRTNRPDHPINCVDWYQAAAYCDWNDKRLPTEAEWEYAARGADGRRYPWGSAAPTADRLSPLAATHDPDESLESTVPVGKNLAGASPFGVLDMAGNVAEWTADWYGAYEAGPATNPQGPSAGLSRVARGGGWERIPNKLRAMDRSWLDPVLRTITLGFRCARDHAL